MAYSVDLRERVVKFMKEGGSKAAASRQFSVSLWCVRDWCNRKDLGAQKPPGRPRKMDWLKLSEDIKNHPDKLLRERALAFGVQIHSIWHASKEMGFTHKKNTTLQRT